MTILNAYESILTELNKVQAPSLLLDDFVYLFNKGVQEYENERYNLFETKQQLTDDLRVLTKSAILDTTVASTPLNAFGTTLQFNLPSDYVHILNCTCEFEDKSPKCNSDSIILRGANKLNTNQRSHVIDNYYLKPSVKNPYYYIVNADGLTLDSVGSKTNDDKQSTPQNERYGNSVQPVMLILYGNTNKYELKKIYIDYLRAPIYYKLNQDQIDDVIDRTLIIEFPDYVIYEIINRIVNLILENGSNPRIQTHAGVNQSIA